jgi:hypothetical protein
VNAKYPAALLCCGLLSAAAAVADPPDQDLALIPDDARQKQPAGVATPSIPGRRIYLEGAFSVSSLRGAAVVSQPATQPVDWQARAFLDVRKEWKLAPDVSVTFSDRLNLRGENDISFPNHENVINDLREAFATWQLMDRTYVDCGRINLKSGVALGFNPTDFFRTRAVVEPLSADPTVLREDRLGTLMVRAQSFGPWGSLSMAFAPSLYAPTPIDSNTALASFNPSLDRTNAASRFLAKDSFDLAESASSEVLVFRKGAQTLFGENLTLVLGQKVTAYAEWAAGRRADLIVDALRYGRMTGTLPAGVGTLLPTDPTERFRSELSVGISYTTDRKVTFNLEYWLNQTGFARSDWNNWFALGGKGAVSAETHGALWFIRNYALDQGEPAGAHSVFLRINSVDTFIPNLEVTGFVDSDLADRSGLVQLGADYYLSDRWTFGGLITATIGGRRSDFGSLPPAATLLVKIARYF